jgi:hypothetical protein
MKTNRLLFAIILIAGAFILNSCETTVNLTSWKNPSNNGQVSKVVIMPLFEKLEYMKPFEESMVACFKGHGLQAVGSLEFLNPNIKYTLDEIKHRCDSLHADAILLFSYQGTEKTENYVPPTTYYTGGYGGYWGGGYWGGYYGGYYGGYTTTGGYWTTTSTINLTAKLFVKGSKDELWNSEISVADPEYIDMAAHMLAQNIYSDWKKYNIIRKAEKN